MRDPSGYDSFENKNPNEIKSRLVDVFFVNSYMLRHQVESGGDHSAAATN